MFGYSSGLFIQYLLLMSFIVQYPRLVQLDDTAGAMWGWGGGGGAYAASQTTVLPTKRHSQTESQIFVILCALCFQRQSFFYFYSTLSLGN